MSTFEAITILVAGYGAILSTITIILRIKDSHHKLRVELSTGFLTYPDRLSEVQLFIKVINLGKVSIPLNSYGFIVEGSRETLAVTKPEGEMSLPCVLEPNNSATYWHNLSELKDDLRKLSNEPVVNMRGVFTTKTGQKIISKKLKIKLATET